ncbi:hypothetical protein QR66_11330 [Chromobacterium piscinae]|nr:hypothetical protein QR66_11330 [Chromobacterium piscinae]
MSKPKTLGFHASAEMYASLIEKMDKTQFVSVSEWVRYHFLRSLSWGEDGPKAAPSGDLSRPLEEIRMLLFMLLSMEKGRAVAAHYDEAITLLQRAQDVEAAYDKQLPGLMEAIQRKLEQR